MHDPLRVRRLETRRELDALPDFTATASGVAFRQSFVRIEADESFCVAPTSLNDACRRLLSLDIDGTVARLVHDNVTFKIGCNFVPPFALVNGGRDRTLCTFRCVYDNCSAFLDVRKFAGAEKLKWVIVGVSHGHDFSSFSSRTPRNTFHTPTVEEFNLSVANNFVCGEIKMKHNVLCPKDVF